MEKKPNAPHRRYEMISTEWSVMRDVVEGETAVKAKGEIYLPRTPGMRADGARADDRYVDYKTRADVPEIVAPAIDAAVGAITNRAAIMTAPDEWKPFEYCATPMGEDIWGFHAHVARELSTIGRFGFAINLRTDPETGNQVPLFVPYMGEQIINWTYGSAAGKQVLVKLVLETETELPKIDKPDELEVATVLEIWERTARGVTLNKLRRTKEGSANGQMGVDTWIPMPADQPISARSFDGAEVVQNVDNSTGYRLQDIPFIVANAQRLSADPGRIPFLGLSKNVLSRYRLSANYYEAISFYEPTPWVSGMTEDWITKGFAPKRLGAGVCWWLPPDAEAGMLEYSGPSIENMRVALRDLEQQALQLAFIPFEPRISGIESGEAKRERRKMQTSMIQDIALTSSRAINAGMDFAADWLGVSKDEKDLWFNADEVLADYQISAQELIALITASQAGAISKRTLHENLQKFGITRMEFDEEQALIGENVLEGQAEDEMIPQADNRVKGAIRNGRVNG